MTLETQVQALTVATESLLQSVNTRKADLDAAQTAAADSANAASNSAVLAATNGAEQVALASQQVATATTQRGSGYFSVPIKRNPNAQITHYMSSGAFTSEEIAIMEQDCPWVGSLDKTHNWEWVCNGKPDPETGQMTGPDYIVVFDNES